MLVRSTGEKIFDNQILNQEMITGQKWIDEKIIYKKIIKVDSIDCTNQGFKYVKHNIINLKNVIRCDYIFQASNVDSNYSNQVFNNAISALAFNNENIRFYVNTNWELLGNWFFIIEYTKS